MTLLRSAISHRRKAHYARRLAACGLRPVECTRRRMPPRCRASQARGPAMGQQASGPQWAGCSQANAFSLAAFEAGMLCAQERQRPRDDVRRDDGSCDPHVADVILAPSGHARAHWHARRLILRCWGDRQACEVSHVVSDGETAVPSPPRLRGGGTRLRTTSRTSQEF